MLRACWWALVKFCAQLAGIGVYLGNALAALVIDGC
jgi:hypothetical protein